MKDNWLEECWEKIHAYLEHPSTPSGIPIDPPLLPGCTQAIWDALEYMDYKTFLRAKDLVEAIGAQNVVLMDLLYKAKLNANSDLHREKLMGTSETKLAILTYLSTTLDALWNEAEFIKASEPQVTGSYDGSFWQFTRRAGVLIKEEQAKPLPDNALIAFLCDAIRIAREAVAVAAESRAQASESPTNG